jgi:hypothetical protein
MVTYYEYMLITTLMLPGFVVKAFLIHLLMILIFSVELL